MFSSIIPLVALSALPLLSDSLPFLHNVSVAFSSVDTVQGYRQIVALGPFYGERISVIAPSSVQDTIRHLVADAVAAVTEPDALKPIIRETR